MAQSIGAIVVVAGAVMLVTSLALLFGLVSDLAAGRRGLVTVLVLAFLGVVLLVLGRKLLRWGSGDRG
jgi:hypothetical protein